MKNLKIEELKKELFTGDFGDCFRDYDNGYICDIISEIANNNIDIYTSDLINWISENVNNIEYIDNSVEEMGRPDNFIKEIQQGQYYYNENDLYNNLEDSIIMFMYDYIEKDLNIKEITEEQNKKLLDWDFSDNNEQLENLIEHINNIMKEEE